MTKYITKNDAKFKCQVWNCPKRYSELYTDFYITTEKQALLEPLVGRKIVLYPDKGDYEDWKRRAEELMKNGLVLQVSNILEESLLESGSDLADNLFLKPGIMQEM